MFYFPFPHSENRIMSKAISTVNQGNKHRKSKCIPIILAAGLFLTACTTQKDLLYLQGLDTAGEELPLQLPGDYLIQEQDILYIRLFSYNQEFNNLLDISETGTYAIGEGYLYINGYQVNDSGYVEVPFIGQVPVLGITVEEARKRIAGKAQEFIKDPVVIVKLLSFKFTILGEVKVPGTYQNYNKQLTVLEAIGMAGDITDLGNRQDILVVRRTPDSIRTFHLNLLNKDILASEAFFVQPNDVIYVKPTHNRIIRINIPTLSFIFASLSTVLLVLNYFK